MYYGGTVTVLGRNLITQLIAGDTIEFTRVVVGKGKMPENVEPIDMKELVEPIAEGTTSVPIVDNGVVHMTIEYRNDMNGGLKEAFWLNEFGVYAKTEDTDEVLLYYATLGDSPQPVNAYKDNRIDIRRYPISIALATDADFEISYTPGAFVTSEEADKTIESKLNAALSNTNSAIVTQLIIPSIGWVKVGSDELDEDGYRYRIDIMVDGLTAEHFPNIAIARGDIQIAYDAALCPSAETLEGCLRLWAMNLPKGDITANAVFLAPLTVDGVEPGTGTTYVLPMASAETLGGIKIGKGLNIAQDGTVSTEVLDDDIKVATSEDAEAALKELFSDEE